MPSAAVSTVSFELFFLRLFVIGFCRGFPAAILLRHVDDGGRLAAGAGDDAGEPVREFAVGAVVGGQQQAFEVGHEVLASSSSRSRRMRSFLRIGSLFSAERAIGGIAMVVTIAMVTMRVNRSRLSTPIDKPMVATITSVEPRRIHAAAECQRFGGVNPPS